MATVKVATGKAHVSVATLVGLGDESSVEEVTRRFRSGTGAP